MRVKAPHSVTMVVDCGASIRTPLKTSVSIWSLLPRNRTNYFIGRGFPRNDLIWGLFNFQFSQESVSDKGMEHERSLHVNILELRAIRLSLSRCMKNVQDKTVAVFSDNITALSYLIKEGGTRSTSLKA